MFVLMLAAAAATATPAPPRPHRRPVPNHARTIVEYQLASPPRSGPAGGVSAEEADVIITHYLASIGTRLPTESASTSGQAANPQ